MKNLCFLSLFFTTSFAGAVPITLISVSHSMEVSAAVFVDPSDPQDSPRMDQLAHQSVSRTSVIPSFEGAVHVSVDSSEASAHQSYSVLGSSIQFAGGTNSYALYRTAESFSNSSFNVTFSLNSFAQFSLIGYEDYWGYEEIDWAVELRSLDSDYTVYRKDKLVPYYADPETWEYQYAAIDSKGRLSPGTYSFSIYHYIDTRDYSDANMSYFAKLEIKEVSEATGTAPLLLAGIVTLFGARHLRWRSQHGPAR